LSLYKRRTAALNPYFIVAVVQGCRVSFTNLSRLIKTIEEQLASHLIARDFGWTASDHPEMGVLIEIVTVVDEFDGGFL
jgi:hypothetical protein